MERVGSGILGALLGRGLGRICLGVLGACLGAGLGAGVAADRFFEFANANMRSRPLVHAFRLNWGRVLSSQSFENGAGVLQALGAGLGAGLGGLGRSKIDHLAFLDQFRPCISCLGRNRPQMRLVVKKCKEIDCMRTENVSCSKEM